MIDFSTLQGLTIPEGVVTQIADASGRVIWSAVKEVGALIFRPSADISVEHFLYPANSDVPAYQRINEEVSDGDAFYIKTSAANDINSPTSKFKLSNTTQLSGKLLAITGVSIKGDPHVSSTSSVAKNEFKLEINGIETESILVESDKGVDISVSVPTVIDSINEYIATHGVLPDINISITSYVVSGGKGSDTDSGVSQIYVVLTYEGY